jgi:hypothetical protein
VSPVKYELGFYIPEDDILHSHCREYLKSYILLSFLIFKLVNAPHRIGAGLSKQKTRSCDESLSEMALQVPL